MKALSGSVLEEQREAFQMLFHSEVLTGASGSIGGVTYSHNRSGLYRRARAIPVNPNTGFQVEVRSALTNAVTRWTSVLTTIQRAAWDLYGVNTPVTNPLGAAITLSGQNWYIGSNTPRAQLLSKFPAFTASQPIDNAPIIFDRGDFTTPVFTPTTAAIQFQILNTDAWASEDASFMFFFMGRPQNASVNFYNGPWRLIGGVEGDSVTPPANSQGVVSGVFNVQGFPLAVGQRLWGAVTVSRADGRYSTRRILGPELVNT